MLTTGFALGQIVGPIISGWVADSRHDLSAGLWVSPVLLALAAVVALFQTERATRGV
jgi:MFS family permease